MHLSIAQVAITTSLGKSFLCILVECIGNKFLLHYNSSSNHNPPADHDNDNTTHPRYTLLDIKANGNNAATTLPLLDYFKLQMVSSSATFCSTIQLFSNCYYHNYNHCILSIYWLAFLSLQQMYPYSLLFTIILLFFFESIFLILYCIILLLLLLFCGINIPLLL